MTANSIILFGVFHYLYIVAKSMGNVVYQTTLVFALSAPGFL
jgi:hypothetical protein